MGGENSIGVAGEHYSNCVEGVRIFSTRETLKGLHFSDDLFSTIVNRAINDDAYNAGSGWGNCWFAKITEAEAEELIQRRDTEIWTHELKGVKEEIEYLEERISKISDPSALPTKAEADAWMRNYNNVVNEGGSGFVPHKVSKEEYDAMQKRLAEKKSQLAELDSSGTGKKEKDMGVEDQDDYLRL